MRWIILFILFIFSGGFVFGAIQTTEKRINEISQSLNKLNIQIISIVKPEEIPSKFILNELYTPTEYTQIKSEFIAKAKMKKFDNYEQFKAWVSLLNGECRNTTLSNINSENLIEKINNKLETGC